MNLDLLLEAERRGILPPDKAELLAEARRRGLVGGKSTKALTEPNTNPGVQADAPPEMFFNPQTGQYTSRELLKNHMIQNETAPTTATGATIMGAGRGATLGGIDELSGYLNAAIPGQGTMAERNTFGREMARAAEEVGAETNPDDMLTSEIAGAISLPVTAPFQAMKLAPRVFGSAVTSGGLGAIYGALTGEGGEDRIDRMQSGGTLGTIVGLLTPLLGAGFQKVADTRAANKAIRAATRNAPSSDELRRIGSGLYDEIDNAGVQIKASSFDDARTGIVDALRSNTAYTPRPGGRTITPNTSAVVDNMADMAEEMAGNPTAALPFKELDSVRRQAGAAAGNIANKSDQQAGMTIIEGLDDFVNRLGPDDVAAGDVRALQTLLPKARDVWSRMSKSQLLDDAIEAGESYLSGSGTGMKYQFKRILKNPKLSRGFTEAEKKVMQRVVNGTIPEQLLRLAGSGLTQIGGTLAAGFGLGPMAGLATLGASTGARMASDAVIRRNAEIARALVANGKMNTLPVASDASRRVIEALTQRAGATVPQ